MAYMTPIDAFRQAETFKAEQQSNALANMLRQVQVEQAQQQMQDQTAMRQALGGAISPSGDIGYQKLVPVAAQSGNLESVLKIQQAADAAKAKQVMRDVFSGQSQSQAQPQSPQATSLIQPQQQTTVPEQKRNGIYQKYLAVADELSRLGMGDAAKPYYDLAEKFRPELKDQKVLMQNGRRVVVNYYKDGTAEVQPYDPDVEKLHFADTGGRAGVGIDPFTGRQVSAGVQRTMTPGEIATNARAAEANRLKASEIGILGGKGAFEAENKLRDEFNKQVGTFVNVRDAHARVLASAENPSAAGDLALIFNYMKVLDPGSTVREGEFATAQNAGSIPDRIRSQYNKVINGERLAPNIRSDFVNRSGMLYEKQKQSATQVADRYQSLAKQYGLRPENVTTDVSLQNQQLPKPAAPKIFNAPPDPRQYEGKMITNPETGQRLLSRGGQWVRVK